MYYSSDKENPGNSYNGASAYVAFFDENFEKLVEYDEKIRMRDNFGIRLYEVKKIQDEVYFMFAQNYMTDKDFVLRKAEK